MTLLFQILYEARGSVFCNRALYLSLEWSQVQAQQVVR